MQAGAKNVLCTLWNVSDRLAEKFMVEFYKNYLAGMSFSRALQKVKVKMINEQSTSLPINWAAYVLIGE
jgi:CHAT domain-containing protein